MSTIQGNAACSTPEKIAKVLRAQSEDLQGVVGSPRSGGSGGFLLPSPVPTRRNRSYSLLAKNSYSFEIHFSK